MAGVNTVQGTTVGVSGKVVCCREAGFWGMTREAPCCSSGLGRHWDVWEIWGGGGGGMGQESSEAVATWGEVVEMLCFRKMGNMM